MKLGEKYRICNTSSSFEKFQHFYEGLRKEYFKTDLKGQVWNDRKVNGNLKSLTVDLNS